MVKMVAFLSEAIAGRMTGLMAGTATPPITGHLGFAVALISGGGSNADWHHLPPQMPEYCARPRVPGGHKYVKGSTACRTRRVYVNTAMKRVQHRPGPPKQQKIQLSKIVIIRYPRP